MILSTQILTQGKHNSILILGLCRSAHLCVFHVCRSFDRVDISFIRLFGLLTTENYPVRLRTANSALFDS